MMRQYYLQSNLNHIKNYSLYIECAKCKIAVFLKKNYLGTYSVK